MFHHVGIEVMRFDEIEKANEPREESGLDMNFTMAYPAHLVRSGGAAQGAPPIIEP